MLSANTKMRVCIFPCTIQTFKVSGLFVKNTYFRSQTMSILWFLMPWVLSSPKHQQPWHWTYKMGMFLSSFRLRQYHGCWCSGSCHRYSISSHDIDFIKWKCSCLPLEGISTTISMLMNHAKCQEIFIFPKISGPGMLKITLQTGLIHTLFNRFFIPPHVHNRVTWRLQQL